MKSTFFQKKNITSMLFFNLFSFLTHNGGSVCFAQQPTWQSLIYNPSHYTQGTDAEMSIATTSDSGVVVVKNSSLSGVILLKMDKQGALTWSKKLGGAYTDKIIQTADKGFLLIGGDAGNIIKTDALGNVVWAKAYGQEKNPPYPQAGEFCNFTDIKETIDGGYILTGQTSNFGTQGIGYSYTLMSTDVYLVKINSAGDIKWTKTYGRSVLLEYGSSVEQTPDKGFIIAGTDEEPNVGQWVESSAFLIKVDSVGTLEWAKTYGTLDPIYESQITGLGEISGDFICAIPTADGGYLATGREGSGWGAWLVKTDNLGNIQWTKEYDINRNAGCGGWGLKLYQLKSNEYVLQAQSAGAFYNGPCGNNQDIFLFNLDVSGNLNWLRTYGTKEEYASSHSFDLTKEGGFAMCSYVFDTAFAGYSNGFGNGYKGGFSHVYKLDSLGKNGSCQNTNLDVYTIPTVVTAKYEVTVMTGSMTISNSMTAINYPIVIDTAICFNAPIVAAFYTNQSCVGDSSSFYNASNASYFEWDFGEPSSGINNTSTLTSPKHLYAGVGTYTITQIVKDVDGLNQDTATNVVEIIADKFISAGSDVTICSGDSVLLVAGGTWLWFSGWTPADSLRYPYNDSSYAFPDTTTLYKATAYNGGCYDEDSLTVNVVPFLTINTSGNITICEGEQVALTASGGGDLLWSTGDTAGSIQVSPAVTTGYSVSATAQSCDAIAGISVAVIPGYNADAGENVTIIKGTVVMLNGMSSGGTVSWSPGEGLSCTNCLNPEANPAFTTTYYLNSRSPGSDCEDIDSVTVYVYDCDEEPFVPNVFSPNADGSNDLLYVYGSSGDCYSDYSFKIYNRWGENVFATNNISEGWDGAVRGKELSSDVFVFFLKGVLSTGNAVNVRGNISLVK